jgi:hypothetical protein
MQDVSLWHVEPNQASATLRQFYQQAGRGMIVRAENLDSDVVVMKSAPG